jgi:hypothetical protein
MIIMIIMIMMMIIITVMKKKIVVVVTVMAPPCSWWAWAQNESRYILGMINHYYSRLCEIHVSIILRAPATGEDSSSRSTPALRLPFSII